MIHRIITLRFSTTSSRALESESIFFYFFLLQKLNDAMTIVFTIELEAT